MGTGGLSLSARNLADIKRGKPWLERGYAEPGALRPPPRNPCRPVWTFAPHTKGIKVRCVCMTEVINPSPRFYNYDYLACVDTVAEAVEVWRAHCERLRDELHL